MKERGGEKMKRGPTLATLKAFVRKHDGKLFGKFLSDFDGMVDCVMQNQGAEFRPLVKCHDHGHNLGYRGPYLVLGSRDYIEPYDDGVMAGFEVTNCCGNWIIAVPKGA